MCGESHWSILLSISKYMVNRPYDQQKVVLLIIVATHRLLPTFRLNSLHVGFSVLLWKLSLHLAYWWVVRNRGI